MAGRLAEPTPSTPDRPSDHQTVDAAARRVTCPTMDPETTAAIEELRREVRAAKNAILEVIEAIEAGDADEQSRALTRARNLAHHTNA